MYAVRDRQTRSKAAAHRVTRGAAYLGSGVNRVARKSIVVRAAASQDDLDSRGAVVEQRCDTIREAKERARFFTTDVYARRAELPRPLGYARVLVNGENVYDVDR